MILLGQGVLAFLLMDAAHAKPTGPVSAPSRPLATALTDLARQSGWQILFDPTLVRGRRANQPQPGTPANVALKQLLRGTGLSVRWLSGSTLMIVASRAEEVRESADPAEGNQMIIVTALKRETVLAETPVSMSVEKGNSLAARGMKDIKAVARRHPELTVLDSGAGQQRLIIRGVAGSGEPTVGVYYDETAISGPGGTTFDPAAVSPDIDLVDIDRTELLRGPQGTLYGASAMSGVVRVIFNRPDASGWHGEGRAGIEHIANADLGKSASLTLNMPLVPDRLAVRASVYGRHIGGFIDNKNLGLTHVGQVDKLGGRIALLWNPDADTDIMASAMMQAMDADNATFWYRDQGRYFNNQSTQTPQSNTLKLYNVTARHNFDGVSMLMTVSHYAWNILRQTDYTNVLSNQRTDGSACGRYFALGSGGACSSAQFAQFATYVESRLPGMLYQPMRLNDWSAELRVSSDREDAAQWTVGAYFERRKEDIRSYALLADAETGVVKTPFDITGLRSLNSSLSQQALFGEWTQHLTPSLAFTIGARLFRYRRQSGGTVEVPNIITGTGTLQPGTYASSETGTNLKALLSYQPSPDVLIYAQGSQGFRPGGVNVTPTLTQQVRTYKADSLSSYELGIKATLMDRRLFVNANVYRIIWNDMINPVTTDSGAFAYNVNVGRATIDGMEADLSIALAQPTMFDARISVLYPRLTQDQPFYTNDVLAYTGDHLPNVPDLTLSAGLQHKEKMAEDVTMTARLDVGFVGAMTSAFNRSDKYFERTPSRHHVDAQVFFEGSQWDVGIALRNIFNNSATARIVSGTGGKGQVYTYLPRTLSVTMGYHF